MSARLPWDPLPATEPDPKGPDSLAATLYRAAISGADAYRGTRLALRESAGVVRLGNRFVPSGRYREAAIVAVGRAAPSMALATLAVLGDRVTQGFVAAPDPVPPEVPFHGVRVPAGWGGGAAAPETVTAAREIAESLREEDLLLLLLSPGAVGGLALPPPGLEAEEFSRWLEGAHARGATGREVGLLVRVLASGGAGGGLLPAETRADVETWIVERGDGPALIGGGPTRPVAPAERAHAREIVERLGLEAGLTPAARERLSPGFAAAPGARVRPAVMIAGPPDGVRAAADLAYDKGWTARLAELELRGRPAAAATAFLERVEALVQAEGPGLADRPKGLVALAMTTLDLPEGVDESPWLAEFLAAAEAQRRRRELSVGLFRTSGAVGPASSLAGAVVGAAIGRDGSVPAPAGLRPVAMRSGITDVGLLAVGLVGSATHRAERSPS